MKNSMRLQNLASRLSHCLLMTSALVIQPLLFGTTVTSNSLYPNATDLEGSSFRRSEAKSQVGKLVELSGRVYEATKQVAYQSALSVIPIAMVIHPLSGQTLTSSKIPLVIDNKGVEPAGLVMLSERCNEDICTWKIEGKVSIPGSQSRTAISDTRSLNSIWYHHLKANVDESDESIFIGYQNCMKVTTRLMGPVPGVYCSLDDPAPFNRVEILNSGTKIEMSDSMYETLVEQPFSSFEFQPIEFSSSQRTVFEINGI